MNTCRKISAAAKVNMMDYRPIYTSKINETEDERHVYFYLEHTHTIEISKEDVPQFDWYIETQSAETVMAMPTKHNIGLILPYKQIGETPESLIFDSYIIDPLNNVEMFRQGLVDDGYQGDDDEINI